MPPVDRQPEPVSLVLRRWKARAGLWLNAQYRRDAFGLLLTGLRSLAGLRLGVILMLLVGFGVWIVQTKVDQPRQAYEILSWVFGLVALVAASPIYASEQQQGTLELLWLARGSSKALLRYKAIVLMTGVGLLALPSVALVSWFMYGSLPFTVTSFFLVTNALLIVAIVAATGTYMPQAWASTLISAVLIAFLFDFGRDRIAFFNLFMNPIGLGEGLALGGGAFAKTASAAKVLLINRLFVIVISTILLSTAARRLRKILS